SESLVTQPLDRESQPPMPLPTQDDETIAEVAPAFHGTEFTDSDAEDGLHELQDVSDSSLEDYVGEEQESENEMDGTYDLDSPTTDNFIDPLFQPQWNVLTSIVHRYLDHVGAGVEDRARLNSHFAEFGRALNGIALEKEPEFRLWHAEFLVAALDAIPE